MNDFIDLPHLPECLLGLPLETIHEIHSHTYHAIKADRQQRGEPSVPWENFPGYLIDHCEGEIISEEGLQHALSSMLQDPLYSDTTPAQEPSDDINIEDVREYLDAWGCLAHPGVVALLARYGNHHIEQPSVPDQALLISMATCLYHGFGLLDQGRQESMLHDMRKLWDEVMGRGYYTPSNRERYISMLAAAPKFGEEQ